MKLSLTTSAAVGCVLVANAAAYTFTQIDVPGAAATSASGINDAGQIVGNFDNGTSIQRYFDTGR
jgi:hypothetical protein